MTRTYGAEEGLIKVESGFSRQRIVFIPLRAGYAVVQFFGANQGHAMAFRYKAFNLSQVQTTSLRKRKCRLHVEMLAEPPDPHKTLQDFLRSLPRAPRVNELVNAADALIQAALAEKDIVWMIDADFIEAGLSNILIRLIDRGFIKSLAMTGAAAVRDYELAFYGMTAEEIRPGLEDGLFGMARETGEGMNEIITEGVKRGFSLGECLGRGILDRQPKNFKRSILAACVARMVTPTIHISMGADGFQCNPMADGAMLGKGSLKDMQILGSRLEGLNEGGMLVAAHGNPTLHALFTQCLALSRNLGGVIANFTTVRFGDGPLDFSEIPGITASYQIPGPLEFTLPLFGGALFSMVE